MGGAVFDGSGRFGRPMLRCSHMGIGGNSSRSIRVKDASGGPAGRQILKRLMVTIQLTPLAALLGAKLLKSLINRFLKLFLTEFCLKGGCDLTRGTRGEAHPQLAFKVAHLAAGGCF